MSETNIPFYAPFDNDLIGDVRHPPSVTKGVLDNSLSKFGSGCIASELNVDFQDIDLTWDKLGSSEMPGNVGSISVWFRPDTGQNNYCEIYVTGDGGAANQSRIDLVVRFLDGGIPPANNFEIDLDMWDDSAVQQINASHASAITIANQWYKITLDWKWNDVGGDTKVYLDSTAKLTDNGGDAATRSGSTMDNLNLRCTGEDPPD